MVTLTGQHVCRWCMGQVVNGVRMVLNGIDPAVINRTTQLGCRCLKGYTRSIKVTISRGRKTEYCIISMNGVNQIRMVRGSDSLHVTMIYRDGRHVDHEFSLLP